jgi:hypothetical protein
MANLLKQAIARMAQSIRILERGFRLIDIHSLMNVYEASLPHPIETMLDPTVMSHVIQRAFLRGSDASKLILSMNPIEFLE